MLIPGSVEQQYADLQEKIKNLEAASGEELKNQMASLKGALRDNPEACKMMLPEEIGEMVRALYRITGTHAAMIAAKKAAGGRGKKKAAPLTAEEMQAALDEL